MVDAIAYLVPLLIIAGAAALVAPYVYRWTQRNNVFREFAERVQGEFHGGGWGESPQVVVIHRGRRAVIDVFTTGRSEPITHTRVRLPWPATTLRCDVYPQSLLRRVGKLLGVEDIEISSPAFDHHDSRAFDRDYIISGNSRQDVRRLLSPEVQAIVNRLRASAAREDIHFSIQRGEFAVRWSGRFGDSQKLEKFVRIVLELYDAAVRTTLAIADAEPADGTGIEFFHDGTNGAKDAAPPMCQICGEEISADPVLCKSCRTPHHHDCWQYFGQCSTFGCGQRACFRPRRQASAKGRK